MKPALPIGGVSVAAALLLVAGAITLAATGKEAHVTRIIRDVKLVPSGAAPRPAVVNELVNQDSAVRTGDASRSELTFVDLTITRLGANTTFSFNRGSRSLQLDSGSLLLYVPKDSGGARMTSSAVTVGITGTTVIFEPTRAGRNKLTVLEGGARLTLNKYPRESSYIRGGWMVDVPPGATKIPPPIRVDLNRLVKTSPLITDFASLPSQDLIAAAVNEHNPQIYSSQPTGGQPTGGFIPPISVPLGLGIGSGGTGGGGTHGSQGHVRTPQRYAAPSSQSTVTRSPSTPATSSTAPSSPRTVTRSPSTPATSSSSTLTPTRRSPVSKRLMPTPTPVQIQ
jgi:hypothetical protein